jgi:hypothetical protein
MPTTEELVLRDGRFIHRQSVITETNIGDASELLSKHIPKGAVSLGYIGIVNWGETQRSAHLLVNGQKYLCYTTLDSLKANLCYRPIFKSEFQQAYEDGDKTLAKDIQTKIHGWQFTGEATPQHFLGRKIKLDIPWDESRWGKLIFAIDGAMAGRETHILSHSSSPSVNQCYLGALRNGEIYTIRLTNHFDHGKVCMGNDWESRKNHGLFLNNLQYAMEAYLSADSNSDLWDDRYRSLWALKTTGTLPFWSQSQTEQTQWPAELGHPSRASILRESPTSIISFMGIT